MKGPGELLEQLAKEGLLKLAGKTETCEVFVRFGHTRRLARTLQGEEVAQDRQELGVACRGQRGLLLGFGAASGFSSHLGQKAASLALASLSPGHAPLPEAHVLGAVPCPPPQPLAFVQLEKLFLALRQPPWEEVSLSLSWAQSLFQRKEGFCARWVNQLLLLEWSQEVLSGVRCHFSRVLGQPQKPPPPAWQELVAKGQPVQPLREGRQLVRLLLAPDVAAPLLVSLARQGPEPKGPLPGPWDLWDLRRHPRSFLPMPCDGEGLPAQDSPIFLGNPQGHPPQSTPFGSLRAPWDQPPQPAPLHLWQGTSQGPLEEGIQQLGEGFLALAPVSQLAYQRQGRFRLLSVLAQVHQGQIRRWGVGVVSGSFSRLLHGLEGTFGHQEHVALGCVVSTPWLLVKNLEVSS